MPYRKTTTRPLLTASALCALTVAGCHSLPEASIDAGQGSRGAESLLYLSNRDGDQDVYVADAGTRAATALTHNGVDDIEALWSPDGQRVLYTSLDKGNADIHLVNADGSGPRRLTDHPGMDGSPQWSPDGKRICFVSDRERFLNIYVMDLDSGAVRNVSHSERGVSNPQWSPDGSLIAYEEVVGNKGKNIVLVAPDGTDRRKLTDNEKNVEFDLAWSPDGRRLAFASKRGNHIDLYVRDRDDPEGKTELQLTDSPWIDSAPTWSPDGRAIAFLSNQDDGVRSQIYVVNADGSDPRRVSHSGAEEMAVRWSGDGQALYYVSFKDGNAEIYRMAADGSDARRLTNDLAYDTQPQPLPAAGAAAVSHLAAAGGQVIP